MVLDSPKFGLSKTLEKLSFNADNLPLYFESVRELCSSFRESAARQLGDNENITLAQGDIHSCARYRESQHIRHDCRRVGMTDTGLAFAGQEEFTSLNSVQAGNLDVPISLQHLETESVP